MRKYLSAFLAGALFAVAVPVAAHTKDRVIVNNRCNLPMYFLLRHNLGTKSNWATTGWYVAHANTQKVVQDLARPGPLFHKSGENIYIYAEGRDRNGTVIEQFSDDQMPREFAGKRYGFVDMGFENDGDTVIILICH